MTTRDLPAVLFLAVAIAFGFKSCGAKADAAEAREELARIQSEALITAIDSAGWELRVAEVAGDLMGRLQEADDSIDALATEKAELARQVATLGGQLREITDMYAQAVGQIEAHGEAHVSEGQEVTADTPVDTSPDSITASFDDGLLSGRLVYRPPLTLAIDPYRVSLSLTTGIVELADGRWASVARSSDPRVGIETVRSYMDPPEPVAYCSLGSKAKAFGWGALGGSLATAVLGGVR